MTKEINIDEHPYYCCPKCGWDTVEYETDEGICKPEGHTFLKIESLGKHVDYWSGATLHEWIEYWKCPDCETEFDFINGD